MRSGTDSSLQHFYPALAAGAVSATARIDMDPGFHGEFEEAFPLFGQEDPVTRKKFNPIRASHYAPSLLEKVLRITLLKQIFRGRQAVCRPEGQVSLPFVPVAFTILNYPITYILFTMLSSPTSTPKFLILLPVDRSQYKEV
jgi:hypothetical protein